MGGEAPDMALSPRLLALTAIICCSLLDHEAYAAATSQDGSQDFTFPENFTFSTATASYQIEGAWNVSGKGENIWDRATHTRNPLMKVDANGDVACDSYHNYKEDIQLIKSLGMKMYRLSLSWSRILPTGAIDKINEDGVRYYNAVIDECLKNDIAPMITIFHWDLPQPLQDIGGWPNDELVDYFVDYADIVFDKFGDRVKLWLTFNEPQSFCFNGYGSGVQAPGIQSDGRGPYLCAYTVLKAHGKAYRLYKEKYAEKQKGKVSMSSISFHFEPSNPNSPEDQAAAERMYQFFLGIFAHPIFSEEGDYPQIVKEQVNASSLLQGLRRSRLPSLTSEEVEMIKGSADFFGLNHYSTYLVSALDPSVNLISTSVTNDALARIYLDPKLPAILANWMKVVPWGFRKLLVWVKKNYNNPEVFITENGIGDLGESLRDTDRVNFYRSYLEELLKAIHIDGCNVIGYTAWSLMDNFEWQYGYVHRYGLHYVDFTDPARPRYPKMSAKFFQLLVKTRKLPKDDEIDFTDGAIPTQASRTK